jgi:UPF0755 protein
MFIILPELKGNRQISKWVVIGSLLFLVTVIFVYGCINKDNVHNAIEIAGSSAKVHIRVKPGMAAGQIGEMLQEHQVISSKYTFWFMAKLNGVDSKFKTGDYVFGHHMDSRTVLAMLVEGKTSTLQVTIPEGYDVRQIAQMLDDDGVVHKKDFLEAAKNFAPYDYMITNSKANYRAEGFLFPDTYEIGKDFSSEDILKLMAKQFDQKLTAEMRERAAEMKLSIYDLVTIASLVEKEAKFDEDRPIIAQVFFSRLRIGMPLQSDTTIQYLLDKPKVNVTMQDIKMESPYNTYQNEGLPPGPIANPGSASIKAVLHPADTDYLYFVADSEGHNHYSKTYEGHLSEVDKVE